MKKQIVVIDGGDAFNTYEEYLSFLRKKEFDFNRLNKRGWKETLSEKLGEGFEVIIPKMPNYANARYLEWKIWFEKLIPFLEDEVTLVGHSLGGIFLAKYLSENSFPKRVRAILLVAPPYDTEGTDDSLVDFTLLRAPSNLTEQSGKIFLYHSEDDPIVPFSNLRKYEKELPSAKVRILKDRGHFLQEEFPELVEDIKGLYEHE